MAQLISGRYASALFSLALEKDCIDKYSEEVKLIHDTVASDSEFLRVLNHPQISSARKLNILAASFKDKVSDDIMGLLNVVFRKNRESELVNIFEIFLDKAEKHKGIVNALVESAVPLRSDALDEITGKLSNKLNKQVVVETKVVPELLGGIRITVDGRVIDGTVKTQLTDIKSRLLDTRLV